MWSLHASPMSAWISSGLPPQSITCILGLMFSWRPKYTDEDLVLGRRTMAVHCPSEEWMEIDSQVYMTNNVKESSAY